MKKLPWKKISFNAILSAFIYSSWALYINTTLAMRSSIAQFALSFIMTFFIAFSLEFINRISSSKMTTIFYILLLSFFLVGVQIFAHILVGTEHIIYTLLPSFIIGSIYIFIYTSLLNTKKR